jgi:hypothetical protein
MIVKMQEVGEMMAVAQGMKEATKPRDLTVVVDRHLHWPTRLVSHADLFGFDDIVKQKKSVNKLTFVSCA